MSRRVDRGGEKGGGVRTAIYAVECVEIRIHFHSGGIITSHKCPVEMSGKDGLKTVYSGTARETRFGIFALVLCTCTLMAILASKAQCLDGRSHDKICNISCKYKLYL